MGLNCNELVLNLWCLFSLGIRDYLDATKPTPSKTLCIKSLGHSINLHVVTLHQFYVQGSTIMLGEIPYVQINMCIVHYFVVGYAGFNTTYFYANTCIWEMYDKAFWLWTYTRYNEIGLCAQKEDTTVGSPLGGLACLLKVKEESSFQPLVTFTLKFDFDSWNNNLHDSQLLNRQDMSWSIQHPKMYSSSEDGHEVGSISYGRSA